MSEFVGTLISARVRRRLLWPVAGGAALLLAAGCVANPSAAGAPSTAPAVSVSPVPSPSPAVAQASSVNATHNPLATPGLPAAAIDVSPAASQLGGLTLSLAMEPARHMLDQEATLTSDPDPAHQAAGSSSTGSTALVLDGLLKLTNNLDPSQPVPEDAPQAMLRHVNVQIHDTASGSAVPYLNASLDLLLDGHPVISNVALLPMIAAEDTAPQLYYGNNLKLAQRGTYQAFVRLQPSPLVGKDQLPTAQFNMVVH